MRLTSIQPKYVAHVPDHLEEGILYISEGFRICSHLCACGCKEEVVTPLSKAEWRLERDRQLVSLYPSIGNWNYDCKSHYYIEENRIRWVQKISAHKIKRVQQRDAIDLQRMLDPSRSRRDGSTSTTSRSNEKKLDPATDNRPIGLTDTVRRILVKLKKFFNG